MKKSDEWVRQEDVDKKLDELVEARGCAPSEISGYSVAKDAGFEPNGAFYAKVRNWQKRRSEEADQPILEVAPLAREDFQKALDEISCDLMDRFLNAVRTVGGSINRSAEIRVTDAFSRVEMLSAEIDRLLASWAKAEQQRDLARREAEKAEAELSSAQRRKAELEGRLKECKSTIATLAGGVRTQMADAVTASAQGDGASSVGSAVDGPRLPDPSPAPKQMSADKPFADAANGEDRAAKDLLQAQEVSRENEK